MTTWLPVSCKEDYALFYGTGGQDRTGGHISGAAAHSGVHTFPAPRNKGGRCRRWAHGTGAPSGAAGAHAGRRTLGSEPVLCGNTGGKAGLQLRPARAFAALLPEITVHRWDRDFTQRASEALERLVTQVPAHILECRPDRGAVEALRAVLDGGERI